VHLYPQCNFGGTRPAQSSGITETQTSQSSSKAIGIKIFTTKHTTLKVSLLTPREGTEYLSTSQT